MKEYFTVIVVALLLFGCSGGEPAAKKAAEETGAANGQPKAETNEKPSGGDDVASKTIGELIRMNIPVVCDISVKSAQGEVTGKVYMKGTSLREELTTEFSGIKEEALLVAKGTKYYVRVREEDREQMQNCEWLEFEGEEFESEGTVGTFTAVDIENLPKTQYTCVPGSFGDEKFEVSGKSCTFEDLLGDIQIPE